MRGRAGSFLRTHRGEVVALSLFAAIALFHLLHLNADPSPLERLDFTDEGIWAKVARSLALTGHTDLNPFDNGLIGAPLYTAAEYVSFKVFGVTLFAARLVSVVALLGIVVEVYVLVRRAYGARAALVPALLIGFMPELAMYAHVAMPITLEIAFTLNAFFCWELAKTARRPLPLAFLAGLSLPLAVLAKQDAVLVAPPLIVFFVADYLLRSLPRARIAAFAAGVGAGALGGAIFFELNRSALHDFRETYRGFAPHLAWKTLHGLVPSHISFVLHRGLFLYPTTAVLIAATSLWALQKLSVLAGPRRRSVRDAVSSLELFCVLWVCTAALLVLTSMIDRRTATFLVPVAVLASIFVIDAFRASTAQRPALWLRVGAGVASGVLLARYLRAGYTVVYQHWLEPAGIASGKGFFAPAYGLFWVSHGARYLCVAAGAVVFVAVVVRSWRGGALVLSVLALTVVGVLDVAWFAGATYAQRSASHAIAAMSQPGELAVGCVPEWLALPTRVRPVPFIADSSRIGKAFDAHVQALVRRDARPVLVLSCGGAGNYTPLFAAGKYVASTQILTAAKWPYSGVPRLRFTVAVLDPRRP